MTVPEYDPLLQRQLRKLGLDGPDAVPSATQFRDLLARIDGTYRKASEDRELLTRSLELSSAEMGDLHKELSTQRDRLEQVVIAVSDALSVFGDLARTEGVSEGSDAHEITGMINIAKRRFTGRISELLGGDTPAAAWADSSHATSASRTVHAVRRSFLVLADQLAELLSQTAQVAAIRKQLEVARTVQQMLVPESDEITTPLVSLAARFEPAAACGGDWWTAHPLGDGRMLVVIGDVTGHGISSAILTGVARAACDLGRTGVPDGDLGPEQVLVAMNRAIYEAGRQRFMMTCAAAVVDVERRVMRLANAGHAFPYLVRDRSARPLVARGSPLGSAPTGEYPVLEVPLAPRDVLVWYTDGVVECEGPSGEPFSERRFRSLCAQHADRGPAGMREQLAHELKRFRGDRDPIDDVTFVVAQVGPAPLR